MTGQNKLGVLGIALALTLLLIGAGSTSRSTQAQEQGGLAPTAGAPYWPVGLYWQYSVEPSPKWAPLITTQSVEYLVIGQISRSDYCHAEACFVVFVLEHFADGGLIPSIVRVHQGVVWGGPISVHFPLSVGQTVSRTFHDPFTGAETVFTAEVVRLETVELPWGSVEAFYIRYFQDGQLITELWYSPMVQNVVKWVTEQERASLERMWQFPEDVAIDWMFQQIREAAHYYRGAAIGTLTKLIDLGIAADQAQALLNELLSPSWGGIRLELG